MESMRVFVSYDRRDHLWVKDELLHTLESAGIKPDYDGDVAPGVNFYQWIDRELSSHKRFILVISESYLDNRSYAHEEMMHILGRKIRGEVTVIPVLKDPVVPESLPFGLRHVQTASLVQIAEVLRSSSTAQISGKTASLHTPGLQISERAQPYVPPERGIRIQVSTECTENCEWCNWDGYPKDDKVKPNVSALRDIVMALSTTLRDPNRPYPSPAPVFKLTGGEPLRQQYWRQIAPVVRGTCVLLTNARQLGGTAVTSMRNLGINEVRVNLLANESRDVRRIKADTQARIHNERLGRVIENVQELLKTLSLPVRFNHILCGARSPEVDEYLWFIKYHFRKWMNGHSNGPGRVVGVGFIQPSKGKIQGNIFDAMNEWVRENGLKVEPGATGRRAAVMWEDMKVEFIHTNCDTKSDIISRCFGCIREQDISIGIDGRVCLCKGWNEEADDQDIVYYHLDTNQPATGIAGAIRQKYAHVVFFSHLRWIGRAFEFASFHRDSFSDACQALANFNSRPNSGCDCAWLQNELSSIAGTLLAQRNDLRPIYEEGLCTKGGLDQSMELAKVLVRVARALVVDHRRRWDRASGCALNSILLILAHLSVDESIFCTGRAQLVRGLARALLAQVAESKSLGDTFLLDSTYCLGTLTFKAFGKDGSSVLPYIEKQLQIQGVDSSSCPWIQYLLGILSRNRLGDAMPAEAQRYFDEAIAAADAPDQSPHSWLRYEVRVEAMRSLGAMLRNDKNRRTDMVRWFEQANHASLLDNAMMRFSVLYS